MREKTGQSDCTWIEHFQRHPLVPNSFGSHMHRTQENLETMTTRVLAPSRSSRKLSLSLLIYLVVSICQSTSGLSTQAKTDSLESRTCSSTAPLANRTNSPFFDSFLEAYGDTVDTIVGLQTTTWNYLSRYHSFDESTVEGFCDAINSAHLYTNVPKFAKFLENTTKKALDETHKPSETVATWNIPSGFRHDRESDIDGYFVLLAEGCSKDIGHNATAADLYITECLDRLKSIVYDHRCTTRYDSRVECNGEGPPSNLPLPSPSAVIRDHFGSSSDKDEHALHVVIVGAGPIGLMLGNALAMLQRRKNMGGSIPPIKILYLETRAEAPGFKKTYTRNWQAHLNLMHFRNKIDPRLIKIIASMTNDKENPETSLNGFVFPLNVIETLLLLSNRDLGAARFLFGVNPLDVVEDLREIPNLVLVDTTGHRLEPLRRGSTCDDNSNEKEGGVCVEEIEDIVVPNHRTPPPPTIPWLNEENRYFYENLLTFDMDFTKFQDFVEERGQYLHVGRSGDIMYPIDETTKVAKSMWWLDIHGAHPLTDAGFREEIGEQTESLFTSEGPVCEWCREWTKEQGVDRPFYSPKSDEDVKTIRKCNHLCYTTYYAQSTTLLRQDINRNIFNGRFNDTFVYHTDSWFPIMGYSFNPSVALATEAEKILAAHGMSNDPIGMSLKVFYRALVKNIDYATTDLSDSDWEMLEALQRYSLQSKSTKWPTVTLFVQQPFIYTNGLKKKKKCGGGKFSTSIGDHLEHAPMIRFGDSFTVGDGLSK
jgi:hypothetical protein